MRRRILIDCHSFDYNYFQGVTTYISGLYKVAVRERKDVDFYFTGRDTEKLKSIFGDHPNVFYLKLMFSSSITRLIFEIPFLIWKNKIDYIHVQYKSPFLKLCKEIVTVHDVLFIDYPIYFGGFFKIINELYYRFSSKRADILLTVSNYSRKKISEHFGIPIDSIKLTPNGVDERFIQLSDSLDLLPDIKSKYGLDKYLIYVSRIEPRKNHHTLVRAFKDLELDKKGYRIVFVGKKSIENHLLSDEIRSLDKKSYLFLTNVSIDELAALYHYSVFSVFPSFAEGFGIPPIESLVMKAYVICSNTTAMKDFSFIDDEMFDPNDFENFKKIITSGINLGFEGIESKRLEALRKYSWNTIGINFSKLL